MKILIDQKWYKEQKNEISTFVHIGVYLPTGIERDKDWSHEPKTT